MFLTNQQDISGHKAKERFWGITRCVCLCTPFPRDDMRADMLEEAESWQRKLFEASVEAQSNLKKRGEAVLRRAIIYCCVCTQEFHTEIFLKNIKLFNFSVCQLLQPLSYLIKTRRFVLLVQTAIPCSLVLQNAALYTAS